MTTTSLSQCCGAEIEFVAVTHPPPFHFTIAAAAMRCTSCKAELWREDERDERDYSVETP